jgi:valyl-tRNA synthetase
LNQQIPKTYDHRAVEDRWYAEWERNGAFEAEPNPDKEPYCIVMPPPNVTGALHMGHALNGSIQDTLIRRARMKGYEALWLPGLDHASIALQNVVERNLMREEGKTRFDVGREDFVERCRSFADESRSQIIGQLKRLGASVDWRRLRYTMDERYVDAVLTAFVDLFDAGLIYRENRITNWCPHDRSAISDLEVNYEDVAGRLYGLRYPFVDGKDYAEVFTTRPETMLGDTALVVNPDDERYTDLVGRRVMVPLVEREIEVLADEYVDPSFGTGVLKVTPAHDPNDFEIGLRLGLPAVNIMDPDGTINENGGPFAGMDREEARKAVAARLDEEGLLGEVRDYQHRVGHCDRCGTVIEPWLSEQWWVSMKELAGPAIDALRNREITVYPDSWRRETIRWLENIHDWNVSRQLWWGHRIPVWYGPEGEAVASKSSPGEGFRQDPDILDTWFSSGLWPFATLGWPEENLDLAYFYPTTLLSTAREIMYLWVARMAMMGLRFKGNVPFEKVNVHSIVLAEDGTKMSKSKGNTINPIDLFDQYGTDAVRYWAASARPGVDTAYSEDQIKVGRKLANKLLNVTKFVLGFGDVAGDALPSDAVDRSMLAKLDAVVVEATAALESFDYARALERTEAFFWWFCDDYVELVKGRAYGSRGDVAAHSARAGLRRALDRLQRLLAPILPFATEEAWSWWHDTSVHAATWPVPNGSDAHTALLDPVSEVLGLVRRAKTEAKKSQRAEVAQLVVTAPAGAHPGLDAARDDLIEAGSIRELRIVDGDELRCAIELATT